MTQPGRKFAQASSSYKYGFNGKEKDNSTGEENLDFGARIYDSKLSRWLSTDPSSEKYPQLSPYNYAANNPIIFSDIDGKDFILKTGVPEALWNSFKSIIEAKFEGLVTLTKSDLKLTGNAKYNAFSNINPTGQKVQWTINEQKLQQMAMDRSKNPNEIEAKKKEILDELKNDFSYKKLDNIINGDKSAIYDLDNGPGSFGDAANVQPPAGFNPQSINVDFMNAFAGQDVLSSFNMMFHEIIEGYNIINIATLDQGDLPATKYSLYAFGHWQALLDQAKSANLDFIYSAQGGIGQSQKNKDVNAITFKQITTGKDKGKYLKTVYTISIENGSIATIVKNNPSVVSKKEFESEKKQAKDDLKAAKKR